MRKAQSSMEAAVLIAVMSAIVLGFVTVITTTIVETERQKEKLLIEDIADIIENEVNLAATSQDGYQRTFTLPPDLNGFTYYVMFVRNAFISRMDCHRTNSSEILVSYESYGVDNPERSPAIEEYETRRVLIKNLSGAMEKLASGIKEYTIAQQDGVVVIAPVGYCEDALCETDMVTCVIAEETGVCNELDIRFGWAYEAECCADYFYCCVGLFPACP